MAMKATAMLGGLQEASGVPGHGSGIDKMFYAGCDQSPVVLDEPEPCLK